MSIDNREPEPFSSDSDKVRRATPIIGEVQGAEFRCQICGQVFTNKADLEEHVNAHERTQEKVEKEAQPAGVR